MKNPFKFKIKLVPFDKFSPDGHRYYVALCKKWYHLTWRPVTTLASGEVLLIQDNYLQYFRDNFNCQETDIYPEKKV